MACTPQQHKKVASRVRRVRSRLVGRSAARSDGRFGVINTPRPACVWFSRAFGRKSNHPGEQRWVQKRIKETAVDYAILYDLSERMRGEFAVGGMVRGWGSRCKCLVRFGRNRHSSAIESPPRFAVLQNCRDRCSCWVIFKMIPILSFTSECYCAALQHCEAEDKKS